MKHTEKISQIAAAMVAAQGEFPNVAKNANNPFYKSKYADIAAVIDALRPILAKHRIAFSQFPRFSDNMVHVNSVVLHESGEYISEELSTPIKDQTPQAVGSAVSYLRRYSLLSIFGLAAEDDDANFASGKAKPQTAEKQATPHDQSSTPQAAAVRSEQPMPPVQPIVLRGKIEDAKAGGKAFYLTIGGKVVAASPEQLTPAMGPGVEVEIEVGPEEGGKKKFHPLLKVLAVVAPEAA